MSGQPVKTHADENRFRNEYMLTLSLQEGINDMNLQANKTYLLTGQLPPSSQMQDTRTNAEKLADVEKMKRDIADTLKPIADPHFAYQIVNAIINSPLNLNNSLLRFLAQRSDSIVEQLKKLIKIGIAGDANDLEQIVNYIKDMYAKQQGNFQSVKSYMNALSSETMGSSKIIGANDLDQIILQLQDIIKNLHILSGGNEEYRDKIGNLIAQLSILRNVLLTTDETKIFLDYISAPTGASDIPEYYVKIYFNFLEELPKYSQVIALINKIKKFIMSNNRSLAFEGIERLNGLFKGVLEFESSGLLKKFERLKKEVPSMSLKMHQIPPQRKVRKVRIDTNKNEEYEIKRNEESKEESKDEGNFRPRTGYGFKKRRGRPRGSGITKVEKPPTFVGFGINEINQRKLDDGILKIRRNTRTSYQDMPSTRISPKLQKVIKTIIGGGMPNFNDLSSLDEQEKEYLHKIVTRSNMEDKLSIPAPSKDQREKDIHNFEVMRGQILSGNDSIELVKKFKLLIRKLSKQGLLPKNDVEDIMETLIDLGY